MIDLPFKNSPLVAWQNRASLAKTGDLITVNNYFVSQKDFMFNGTRWAPVNGFVNVTQSGLTVAVTGTTAKTALATVTIPGGLMSSNGCLEIILLFGFTANTNSKTMFVEFDGQQFLNRTEAASSLVQQTCVFIRNANSTSSQVGFAPNITAGFEAATTETNTTIDTSWDKNLIIYGQLAVSTDTIELMGYAINYRE